MIRLAVLATILCLTCASGAPAQLLAFPGAEGVARHVTGGRGGDVYKVTNLNDSGAGSLRHGVESAPSSGRTIVFDVAGTIQLNSYLRFNGKSNLTIAGQTAPAGGITVAGNGININNADNVILQHLRVRPGYDAPGDPDAVWVSGSTNVMIDHVTASWGVDETISTTHNSNNVTVQWSTMSQGLYDGGHEKGPGHSYGSLINGGAYSYHHNLYAHNKSRHPRAQDSGNYLRLDFVNNVMVNPQDRFGYSDSDDPFDVNFVGNLGIKGPRSSSNNDLFVPDDIASTFFVAGNATDTNKDGLFDPSPVDGDAVFRSDRDYTLSPTRLSAAQLPSIATHSVDEAYLHVLSRAGALNYRDPVDRQLIRSVINQTEYSIDRESDIGGLPTLPTGPAATDSNGDGVPDQWATARGFAPSTNLATSYAPSGYTHLEEYLHGLTPFAYAPPETQSIAITTADGRGADASLDERSGGTGIGDGTSVTAAWGGAFGETNNVALLRFDLSAIEAGSIAGARLDLTNAMQSPGSHTFRLYGVEHDAEGWDWEEQTVEFDTAPGVTYDGATDTLAIDPFYDANDPADLPGLFSLGEVTTGPLGQNETVAFDNANLGVFLNLAAFFEGEAQQGLVSLLVESISNNGATFHSSESQTGPAPRLVLEAVSTGLPGDFNGDGAVDASDYTVWRDGLGTEYAQVDYDVWAANYGAASSPFSESVPEPAAAGLLASASLLITASRRPSRQETL